VTGGDSTSTFDLEDRGREDETQVEVPRLLVAFSFQQPFVPGLRVCMASAQEMVVGRGATRSISRDGRCIRLTIDDHGMSRRHLRLRRLITGWELEDLGSKNGTIVNGERCERAILDDGDVIEVGATMLLFREEGLGARDAFHQCHDRDLASETRSGAPTVFRTLALGLEQRHSDLVRIARASIPVLLRGETGTGKELIARAVHDESGRSGAFVAINCGALPRNLIESELFGHRRGSFSDARQDRDGLVRRAHGGTLFLDEIAELPPESQVALLRVLQDGEVRPVGAIEALTVDVRVVAATHQDMAKRIAMGRFREDLYARLAGFELELPPLRDRREDIGALIAAILLKLGDEVRQVTFHREAARALFGYPYPLNIRGLEQALRSAVVLAEGRQIRLEHLPETMRDHGPPSGARRPEDSLLRERLHEILFETRGNVTAAARTLNKAPTQIRRWCRRLSIDLASYRS
jgi:transcriptional regulator of acetoin/glycerol metabolism